VAAWASRLLWRLVWFDASGVSLYHTIIVDKSKRGVDVVLHRLGFCAQSESIGEGGYPYINIEVHCEFKCTCVICVCLVQVRVDFLTCEVILYLVWFLELFVRNGFSDSGLVGWRREFCVASWFGGWRREFCVASWVGS